jgi:hypothetical protein
MQASSKLLLTLIIFLCVIAAVGSISALLLEVPKYYRFMTRARCEDGKIVSKELEKHRSVVFEYEVQGQIFRSPGRVETIGRSFDNIEAGDIIPICFDEASPSIAVIGSPGEYFRSRIIETCIIMAGFTFCLLIYIWKRK